MDLEEGDIVLCTVDRIVGTVVFVKLDDFENVEGSIITSEIAPGRIRNLRDYVVPGKKITCKVLRIKDKHIELSLRRVTQKERKQLAEQHKQEKSFLSVLNSILGNKAKTTISEIKDKTTILDFLEEVKENPKPLEKLVGKKDSEKIMNIITSQKQKNSVIKKELSLKSIKPNGVTLIKSLLRNVKGVKITYIGSGKYSLSIESSNLKAADHNLQEIIKELEKKAKQQGIEFSVKEK